MNTIPPYWKPMLTKMHSMVGNPETDRDRLVATSPALNADKIRTPCSFRKGPQHRPATRVKETQMVPPFKTTATQAGTLDRTTKDTAFTKTKKKSNFMDRLKRTEKQPT